MLVRQKAQDASAGVFDHEWCGSVLDGQESVYSWSDADSDFEYLPMEQATYPSPRQDSPKPPTQGKNNFCCFILLFSISNLV